MAMGLAMGTPLAVQAQSAPAPAEAAHSRMAFSIPAQPLASALGAYAAQSGRQVLFDESLVQGRTAPAVQGQLSARQALTQLLAGSGIHAMPTADGSAVTLRAARAGQASRQSADDTAIEHETVMSEVRVIGTAEEALRQAPGVSIITSEDLARRPPANDLAEILRTQPGVNLTGASSSGFYGNQRQIDLRGMGPDNTLILVDGKPVLSRNAAITRRSGESDTGGDTNWVPADQVERIEVIRGPAAARYGSGAAGGVVNIITKKPTDHYTGSITTYMSKPQHSVEGTGTRRLGFNLAGPLSENLSFRLYGNMAKTAGDKTTINEDTGSDAAGREGRRNRDVNALLHWRLTPDQSLDFETGFSRQGNIASGETPVTDIYGNNAKYAAEKAEVRRTYRQTAAVTHTARWGDFGDSRVIFQYEGTRNINCSKGNTGKVEDACENASDSNDGFIESKLQNYFLNGELHTPFKLGGLDQVLTSGLEARYQKLDDPNAVKTATGTAGLNADAYSKMSSTALSAYLEDNIEISTPFILTPGLRFDHYNQFGSNLSPSLNASYELSSEFTLKGGIARVFKAPNLYQTNPYYYYRSNGGNGAGCPTAYTPCQIVGNPDLDPEVSTNKEIGLAWDRHDGWDASLTYFRNDYKNKIVADLAGETATKVGSYYQFKWYNSGPALIHGLEGNFNVPLLGASGSRLKLINNMTWMFSNKSKRTGQPVSIIPKYTLNSTLDWHVTQKFSAQATATLYGRQKPRTVNVRSGSTSTGVNLTEVGSYAMFGLSGSYEFSKNYRLTAGVGNVFDKTIRRQGSSSGTAGAATYNESGRNFYASFTASF